MVSVCTVPARGARSCERFGGYKTINQIPLIIYIKLYMTEGILWQFRHESVNTDVDKRWPYPRMNHIISAMMRKM